MLLFLTVKMRTVILIAVVFVSEYLQNGFAQHKTFGKIQGPPRAETEADYIDGPPRNPNKKFVRTNASPRGEDEEVDEPSKKRFSKQRAPVEYDEYQPQKKEFGGGVKKTFGGKQGNPTASTDYPDRSKRGRLQGPPRAETETDYIDGPPRNPDKKFARPNASPRGEDEEVDAPSKKRFSKQRAPVEYDEYQPQRKAVEGGSKKTFN